MYYLKYRPRTLLEIDNADRRTSLEKILSGKNIPHAFLFVGPKGTGKTSTARIIAKILNCEKRGHSIEPCEKCDSCIAINNNRFFDVFELDAASNRGIDDIRALREQIGFAPAHGRYKIYIIDEVHMLTKEAFNALLKTLEEPPPNVVFILATTEGHKLPDTIMSRCVSIQFGKATFDEIKSSLKRIVKGERLQVEESILELVATHSIGSFRDAAKLLELAVTSTDLKLESVRQLLTQNVGHSATELLSLIVKKETQKALKWLNDFDQKGGNFVFLTEELLNLLHQELLAKRELKKDKLLDGITLGGLNRLLKTLLEAYQLEKFSPIDSLPLMIAVIDYSQME